VRSSLTGLLGSLIIAGACDRPVSPAAPSPSPTAPQPPVIPAGPELALAGDPEAAPGATWTLRGTLDGATIDLQGVVLKPRGTGPFPAVILSHGYGGSAQFGRSLGTIMRQWGLVCIAANYTHAGGVAIGAPGTPDDLGASAANVIRAHATLSVLARLGYVDLSRVAAHGHSMGAFVTTAFVAAYPADIRVASHTAGGVRPDAIPFAPAPGMAAAALIRTPYEWHHGEADDVVPLALDQLFDAALARGGAPHQGHVYPGERHGIAQHDQVLERVRAWYASHGMF
jgi:dienelactone hydrolase